MGNPWWSHHGRDDARFPGLDPRRNWARGTISAVREASFVVDHGLQRETAPHAAHRGDRAAHMGHAHAARAPRSRCRRR